MFQIAYTRKALKGLKKMPANVVSGFMKGFSQLANGKGEDLDIKKLQGRDGYRMRIGQWRAIYTYEDDQLVILVLDAGPRGGIYK